MQGTDKSKQHPSEPKEERKKGSDNAVTNTVIDTMTLINRSYVYDFASAAYCREHGRGRKDVVGHPVASIFGETSFKKFIKKHLDQCFAGNVVHYENWLEIPGEEPRFYRVSYSPYFNASGQVTHAVVASHDITDQKKEQESLAKSEPGFKTIMKSMHYGVFTFDTEGRFTFVNDVVIERSGYPREWYVGKNLFEVVRPHERASVQKHFKATVAGEQVPPYEFSYLRAENDVAWVHISTTAIREGGRVVGVLGVLLDITKRVQSEQALKESELKYRTLFQDSRDAIFITDRTGRLTDVNPTFLKLFGCTEEEAHAMRAIDTYVDREECKEYVKAIGKEGFVEEFTVKLKKKDGTVMECFLNGTPLRAPDGTIQGYQGIARVKHG